MTLRGYDDFDLTLGEEMRGHRALLGIEPGDVERDLRIRARTVLAIEQADLSGFPNQAVVPGYVRAYARYLGMDAEDAFARFRAESGYRSVNAPAAGPRQRSRRPAPQPAVGLTSSRFAPAPAPQSLGSGISLGAVVSTLALVAMAGGLSYAGWHVLQDIQRVGVADARPAPEIVADAVTVEVPASPVVDRPDPSAYDANGVLAYARRAADEPPRLPSRDGPIAELDPARTGLYAPARGEPAAEADEQIVLASLAGGIVLPDRASDAERLTMSAAAVAEAQTPPPGRVAVRAAEEAWLRIRDADGAILFEGLLGKGDSFELPADVKGPQLRAGNAGAVFVTLGGRAYGPVGRPGSVVKRVAIDPEAVRKMTPAEPAPQAEEQAVQRAALD